MNKFNRAMRSNAARALQAVRNGASRVAAGTSALVVSGAALATEPTGFDSSTIVAKIEANAAEAVLIVGAFILGIWGLKAMGLFKRG